MKAKSLKVKAKREGAKPKQGPAQTLKDSELRYRRLFEAAQDGILILDAETGMIEDVNPYLIKMLGYSREEFIKKKLWEVGAFKDIEASQDAFEALQKNKYIRYEDLPLRAKDGRLIQVEFVSNVYPVGGEKVIQCNIRDITEHKRIMVALQENEKKYYDLVNESLDGMFLIELSGNILTVNNAMCKELGYNEEEFLSMSIWDIIPEQYLDQYRKSLTKILEGESLKRATEYTVRGKDGKNHYVEVLSAPHYSGKDIIGFQGIARDITERKAAEETLREKEVRYRSLFEQTHDAVFILDLMGKHVSANQRAADMLGYTAAEILKLSIKDTSAEITESENLLKRLVAGERIPPYERLFRKKNGQVFPVEINVELVGDSNGNPLHIQSVVRDITERKQAEEALRKSETELREAQRLGRLGSWDWDTRTDTITWSEEYYRIYGFDPKQPPPGYEEHLKAYTPESAARLDAAVKKSMETGESFMRVLEQVRPDGTSRWINTRGEIKRDTKGEIAGLRGTAHDITEQKLAEEDLWASEQRFRALIENSSDAITLLDAKGIALYDSPAAPGMLGYAPEDWIGRDVFALIHPDDLPKIRNLFQNLVETPGARVNSTFRLRHKSGSWLWIEMIATNLLSEPSVKAIVLNYRDFTERKRAEDALKKSEASLEEAQHIAHLGSWEWEAETDTPTWSKELCAILEVDPTKPVPSVAEQDKIYTPESMKRMRSAIEQAMAGTPYEIELERVREDGTHKWLLALGEPRFDKNGHITGLRGTALDITERKRAVEALRSAALYARSLIEASLDPLVTISPDGKITDVNQATETVTGVSRERLIGDDFSNYFTEPEKAREGYKKVLAEGMVRDYPLTICHATGNTTEVLYNATVYKDAAGNVQGVFAAAHDITERKRAQEALRQSEERFRNLYENSTIGIYRTTPDGSILLSNPAIVHMLGYESFEELAKHNLEQDGNNAGYQRSKFREMIERDGEVRGIESEWKKRDGTPIFIRESARLVRDDDGKILYYDGTVEDITEKKRAEEALRNSEIKLRSLFAAMLDVIIVYDADGRYLEIAPTNPTDHYRPLDDMLGKTVTELFPPDQANFFLDHIRQTLRTGQLTNAEYSISFGDQVRWFSASVSPLSSNSVIWVAHDMTRRKAGEERIKRQLGQLSALNEIDRMIASSFDLHLSLTSIIDRVIPQLKVDAADILVMNPDLNILEFGAGHGFHTLGIEKGHLSLGEGYAGRAAFERQIIHIPDLRTQVDNPIHRKTLASENFVGYYAVPLIAKGKVKGVLEVFHRSPLDPDFEWLDFLNMLAGQAALAIDNATMFGNLQRSNSELTLAYDATIEGWSQAMDLRGKETEGHTQRVTQMTVKLARAFGLSEAELVQVRWGGLLHDIGKMGVPDGILLKPGPLTDEEWVAMKKHPTFAYEMLSPIRYLRLALDIPYCHHEKWDGTGYPRGLKGEQIPLTARIFAVVDVWDALTSDRPYRAAWPKEKVREHIRTLSGTHFDPQVVKTFLLEHG